MQIQSKQYFLPGGCNTTISPFWQTIFRYVPGVLLTVRFFVFLYLETSTPQFNLTKTGAKMRRETAEISERYVKENAPGESSPETCLSHPDPNLKKSTGHSYWPTIKSVARYVPRVTRYYMTSRLMISLYSEGYSTTMATFHH